jgi:uroporphyrinogen decarboxylase-like protein
MTENPTPRQMVKRLLQGIAPPRPLFLPIVFSPGARVENQPLAAYLSNPTKICNAQRQLHGALRTDGYSCYFDPFLEVEALGATLLRGAADQPPAVRWPEGAEPGEMPDDLRSPEEAAQSGRVPIAIEVLRRMKAMVRDDSILMAGVTGPFTLAARITQMEAGESWRARKIPEPAVEFAAAVVTRISGAFVEAGAGLIMIQEDVLPRLSQERCATWASALEPAFNVIRFYEALPVLQLTASDGFVANSGVMLQRRWDCVLCPSLHGIPSQLTAGASEWNSATLGLALTLETFQLEESALQVASGCLRTLVAALRPALLTTANDVPAMIDMKRLDKVLEKIPRSY